jgi:hypothetical protein
MGYTNTCFRRVALAKYLTRTELGFCFLEQVSVVGALSYVFSFTLMRRFTCVYGSAPKINFVCQNIGSMRHRKAHLLTTTLALLRYSVKIVVVL